jgi:flagella basal body P-ring formation protein FlgA
MIVILPLFLAFAVPQGSCLVLNTDVILAKDVAVAVPAFAAVPEDFRVGTIPGFGTPRILRGEDLQRVAKNRGVDLDGLPDLCFERPTFLPSPEQTIEAMRTSLNIPGAKIEITGASQNRAPLGEIVFPRSGLQYSSASQPDRPVIWRGFVRYGENRNFAIWAMVRITAASTRIVPVADIPLGKPIREDQVRLESYEDSPLDDGIARNLEDVVGLTPRVSLRAHTPIRKSQVQAPPDVQRGDLVKVKVNSGAAHLELEALAETSGSKGATVLVRNPTSGKDFRARVSAKGEVTVQ